MLLFKADDRVRAMRKKTPLDAKESCCCFFFLFNITHQADNATVLSTPTEQNRKRFFSIINLNAARVKIKLSI